MNILNYLNKRKKLTFIIWLVLVVFGLYLLFFQNKTTPTPDSEISPTITKTEIPYSVTKTSPRDKQEYVLDNTDLLITFNRNLNEDERNTLEIPSTPEVEFERVWESNSFLRLKPTQKYKISTVYEITLTYKDMIIHTFSFSTNPISTQQLDQQTQQLVEDALMVSEAQINASQKYPWDRYLPIVREKYTIIYNYDRNAFRIRIKVENPSENEKDAIINAALNDLKKIGVDTEKILYYII